MTLVYTGTTTPWTGQTINGVNHPLNIEQVWSDEELANIGLQRVVPLEVPDGKMVSGFVTIDLVEGVPTEVATLVDIPIVVSPLSMRRVLRSEGLFDAVNAVIANSDANVQDAWEYATEIRSDSPMLAALAAQLDPPLTSEQIKALFIAARDLPSL